MATSSVTLTVNAYPNGRSNDFNHLTLHGTIAVGAGDYPANGLPIVWSGFDPPIGAGPIAPAKLESPSSGFIYRHDMVHKTIRIFVTGTASGNPLSEVATTTPAGVVADTIYFEVKFNRA